MNSYLVGKQKLKDSKSGIIPKKTLIILDMFHGIMMKLT